MTPRLTKAEEEVMLVMWELKEAVVRDVIKKLEEPDTPYTTVSTVIRILEKKGFVTHRAVGTTYLYYPAISKKEYLRTYLRGIVKNYFDGSSTGLVSFFAKESDMDLADLRELLGEVEAELKEGGEDDS